MKNLKPKKSTGHDNISSQFLIRNKHAIAVPISILINKSLENGEVPTDCKVAKVVPIHKSKSKESFTNYRPISLLPSVSKVLEKVVHKRVYHFLNTQNLLSQNHYGFRPKHNTSQAVLQFTANILNSLDNKLSAIGVFLDLSKAFDTIDHKILLQKLDHYGIRGIALEWFSSYLSGRSQFVDFNGTSSRHMNLNCGVPQGSVLGPLLFIIYTNDLPNALKFSKCILFANNTTIFLTSNNVDELYAMLNLDLNTISDWFKANKLTLNISKTNYMVFTKCMVVRNSNKSLKLGDQILQQVPHTKFLGINIDEHLDWQVQINACRNKISSGIYALNSLKNILPTQQLKSIYYSLVHSHLSYGLVLWGAARKQFLHKLNILQNKALRSISRNHYRDTAQPIYEKFNIPNIQTLYQIELSKIMYLFSKGELPTPLMDLFSTNTEIHKYNTRQRYDPHVVRRRTNFVSNSFIHESPKLWLTIPDSIKKARTMASFKKNVKQFFTKLIN